MSVPTDEAAEQLARRFHETYERLAPLFGYETRPETRVFDPLSPNGKLMMATCTELGSWVLAEIVANESALASAQAVLREAGEVIEEDLRFTRSTAAQSRRVKLAEKIAGVLG